MQTIRRQIDSPSVDEFTFETDEDSPSVVVNSFIDWLSEYIANGAQFTDGQTLQYGYTLLNCRVHYRVLQLFAPDFQNIPINWVENLGAAFRIVAAHKYIPETFSLTPNIPTLSNTAIVGELFDELPMFINRLSPVESNLNDSGWFIGSMRDNIDNNAPDKLQLITLHEAMLAVPHALEYLSLPIGYQVVFTGEHPVILRDFEELEIPKDSYLYQRFNAQ